MIKGIALRSALCLQKRRGDDKVRRSVVDPDFDDRGKMAK